MTNDISVASAAVNAFVTRRLFIALFAWNTNSKGYSWGQTVSLKHRYDSGRLAARSVDPWALEALTPSSLIRRSACCFLSLHLKTKILVWTPIQLLLRSYEKCRASRNILASFLFSAQNNLPAVRIVQLMKLLTSLRCGELRKWSAT